MLTIGQQNLYVLMRIVLEAHSRVIALTTDTSVLTAWSNDFDYSTVFQRQIQAFDQLNGLSLGLSTSGRSSNVLSD